MTASSSLHDSHFPITKTTLSNKVPEAPLHPRFMKTVSFISALVLSITGLPSAQADDAAPWLDLPTIEDRSVWESWPEDAADIRIELARREMERVVPEFSDELFLEYSQTGNRRPYDQRHGNYLNRYEAIVLGELLQNDGEFLPAITTAIEGLLAERTWVLSAHDSSLNAFYGRAPVVDLASSRRGMSLAFVSVLLEPVLPAELVQRMREAVITRVTEVYREVVLSGEIPHGLWWMRTTNNWNAVCHFGVVSAALTIEEDAAKRAEILSGMNQYLPAFIDGFTDDGYCTEGMGYWNYGFGNFAMLAEVVRRASGGTADWLDSEKVVAISLYPSHFELVDQTYPTFADGVIGSRPNPVLLDYLADRMAAVQAVHPQRSGVEAMGLSEYVTWGLAGDAPVIPAEIGATDRRRDGFPEAGLVILRPGESGARVSLAAKTGHNAEHHNHNDVGTIVVAVDKTHLILDPGGEIYTSRTFSKDRYVSNVLNSFGHPVPRIGETLQSTGAGFRGEILSTRWSPDLDQVVMDLAPAYEVDGLKELTRQIGYSRVDEGAITLTDGIDMESPEIFETALVSYGKWESRGENRALLYQGDAALELTWSSEPAGVEVSTFEIVENLHHGNKPLRIAFTMPEAVTRAQITIAMTPAPSPISYTVDLTGYEPRLDQAIRIQAESFSAESGGEVMEQKKVGSDGMAFKNWDAAGHALSWEVQVPADGLYGLRVRYTHAIPGLSMRSVQWQGIDEIGTTSFPSTGGWSSYQDDWSTVYAGHEGTPCLVTLEQGPQILTMTNLDGHSLNLDWIELVPVDRVAD